ncbi:MAG TPA: hypothetical protein VN239_02465 [Nitrososphaera sp.]|jgi:hypothetical protein|nr:hypothetical protein [Nitrososphaera sp.]
MLELIIVIDILSSRVCLDFGFNAAIPIDDRSSSRGDFMWHYS